MVVRAYAVCIGVTPECRRTESEMVRDGQGHADEAYHDSMLCNKLPKENSSRVV